MDETSGALVAVLERISGMKSTAIVHLIRAAPPTIDDVLTGRSEAGI